jgi:hypothetical protein
MAIQETAETWVRVDLICDGLDGDHTCVRGANNERGRISEVAPTADGARKALLNAAVRSSWPFDLKLQRWICPACASVRETLDEPLIPNGPVLAFAAEPGV